MATRPSGTDGFEAGSRVYLVDRTSTESRSRMPPTRIFAATAAALSALLLTAIAPRARAELTLQPSQTLDTTLTEGTWMQPDGAPDGRSLLFDLLGDIYALDRAGGDARPVLAGPAFESHPVFSPDCRRFAFISDRSGIANLWIADADGSNATAVSKETDLTVFTSPAWSPDGRAVFVSRMKHPVLAFELWRFAVVGGAGEVIVKAQPNDEDWDARINALGAAVSPEGRYLYYSKKLGNTWTEKQPPNWSIVSASCRRRSKRFSRSSRSSRFAAAPMSTASRQEQRERQSRSGTTSSKTPKGF